MGEGEGKGKVKGKGECQDRRRTVERGGWLLLPQLLKVNRETRRERTDSCNDPACWGGGGALWLYITSKQSMMLCAVLPWCCCEAAAVKVLLMTAVPRLRRGVQALPRLQVMLCKLSKVPSPVLQCYCNCSAAV